MKATGIVRRIDDLGRVVIPKEIRRTMRIREGDPLYNLLLQEKKLTIIKTYQHPRIKRRCCLTLSSKGVRITPYNFSQQHRRKTVFSRVL